MCNNHVSKIVCLRLVDEERQSNTIAETDKGGRKRSVTQFQSDSIVGIYPTYEQVKCHNIGVR